MAANCCGKIQPEKKKKKEKTTKLFIAREQELVTGEEGEICKLFSRRI